MWSTLQCTELRYFQSIIEDFYSAKSSPFSVIVGDFYSESAEAELMPELDLQQAS